MALKYLSPTSINTYLRCPRKFFLRYVRGMKEKPSIYLVRGKAVHEALAGLNSLEVKGLEANTLKARLLALYDQAWDKQQYEIERLQMSDSTIRGFHREGAVMLANWFDRNQDALMNRSQGPKSEVKIFSQKHRVMGIIDAIHGQGDEAVVVDYKTSRKDEITKDIKVQMAIYALLHQEKFGHTPREVAIDFLATGSLKRFKVTDKLLRFAEGLCRDFHKRIASKDEADYPCTCGGRCQWDFLSG